MKSLKNKSDMISTQSCDLPGIQTRKIASQDFNTSTVCRQNTPKNRQQRCFAAARWARQENGSPPLNPQIHAIEHMRRGLALAIRLRDTIRANSPASQFAWR
jgi:hypothetical protein